MEGIVDVREDSSLDGAPVYPSEGRLLGFVEVSVDVVTEGWADGCDEELNDGDGVDFNDGCDEDINDGYDDDSNDGCNEDINDGDEDDFNDGCDEENNDGGNDDCSDGCNDGCTVFAEGIMFASKSRVTKPLLT